MQNLESAHSQYHTARANALACGWRPEFLNEIRDRAYSFNQVSDFTRRKIGASKNATLAITSYTQACMNLRWVEAILFNPPQNYPAEEA